LDPSGKEHDSKLKKAQRASPTSELSVSISVFKNKSKPPALGVVVDSGLKKFIRDEKVLRKPAELRICM
jgi:hypothetical protein